jgi:hypothetical protein
MERLVLTNVRLTADEHRAAKQRALEEGVSLAELLRRALLVALSPDRAREGDASHAAHGVGTAVGRRPQPGPPAAEEGTAARLQLLQRTGGIFRDQTAWLEELEAIRDAPFRPAQHRRSAPPPGGDGQ